MPPSTTHSIYLNTASPPKDHVAVLRADPSTPAAPDKPSYGIDSPAGLIASMVLAPMYLYTTLKGKFSLWDDILVGIPSESLYAPSLDAGCGRGMVLLKFAELKKVLPSQGRRVEPAYGIDLFITGDQSGNSPLATYHNAAALDVLDQTILHTASFDRLPFADNVFGVVTSSLAIHNATLDVQRKAVEDIARVCQPEGWVVLVDLKGYGKRYEAWLSELGWTGVKREWAGVGAMFGCWPCEVIKGRKPAA